MLSFLLPTTICFGDQAVAANAARLRRLGDRALVVTGSKSAKLNGSQRDMERALQAAEIDYAIYDAVSSNPSIELVREAAGVARKEQANLIIGIGGGSPLDAAKAVAVLANNDVDDTELLSGNFKQPVLPVVAVPTTAGTGSEVTQYAILTNERMQSKSNIVSEQIFPRLALLDPRYTESLPWEVTVNTMADALSHAVESYLSVKAGRLSCMLAREGMQLIASYLRSPELPPGPAREQLLYASLLGGMAIAQTGTTAVHALGYSLTYFKGVEHGRANGLLLYQYLRLLEQRGEGGVANVVRCLGLAELPQLGDCLSRLLPARLALTPAEIELYASIASKTGNIGNTPLPLTQGDLADIIARSCLDCHGANCPSQ